MRSNQINYVGIKILVAQLIFDYLVNINILCDNVKHLNTVHGFVLITNIIYFNNFTILAFRTGFARVKLWNVT